MPTEPLPRPRPTAQDYITDMMLQAMYDMFPIEFQRIVSEREMAMTPTWGQPVNVVMQTIRLKPGERLGAVQIWKTEMQQGAAHGDVWGPGYNGKIVAFLRNGDHVIGLAEDFSWCHHGGAGDIVAWAPLHNEQAPEQAPAPEPAPEPEPQTCPPPEPEPAAKRNYDDDGPAEGYYRVERSETSSRYGFHIVCRDGSARFTRIEDGRDSGMSHRCAEVIQKALEEDLHKWRKEQGKC